MAEVKNNPDELKLPSKRTPETTHLEIEPKKPKLNDTPPPQNDPVLPILQQDDEQQQQQQQVEEEEVNGKDVVDRKGKGILIEDDDDDDDDNDELDDNDESDSDSDSDSGIGDGLSEDSEFEDNPLAEVDLDNILPSRTRRKTFNPDVFMANRLPHDDDDDDESDDPDA